jgi:glycosyltransferase involved in cell wall biosynthesis
MRCLFVMEDHPISPDAPGGGPVLMYSRLELLARAGVEINLVILSDPSNSYGFSNYVETQPEVWSRVRSWCASHQLLDLSPMPRRADPVKHFLLGLYDPTSYLYTNINERTIAAFKRVLAQVEPDVIWAENVIPALLARRSTESITVIYGHHDWLWRVLKLQRQPSSLTLRSGFIFELMRRVETSLVRQVRGCVSASVTEAEELKKLNSKHVAYLPITYAPVDLSRLRIPLARPRIVHLGGMNTVANRVGLQEFLDVSWPIICRNLSAPPELWVIGSLKGAPQTLLESLERAKAVCPGFVQDLSSALHLHDINIIPWGHNTGTRTRIPVALNYAQLVVSTKAAAGCLPELKAGEDCILVDDLAEMGREILTLLSDQPRRRKLASSGRKSFQRYYTCAAVQPLMNQFIDELRSDLPPRVRMTSTMSTQSTKSKYANTRTN